MCCEIKIRNPDDPRFQCKKATLLLDTGPQYSYITEPVVNKNSIWHVTIEKRWLEILIEFDISLIKRISK